MEILTCILVERHPINRVGTYYKKMWILSTWSWGAIFLYWYHNLDICWQRINVFVFNFNRLFAKEIILLKCIAKARFVRTRVRTLLEQLLNIGLYSISIYYQYIKINNALPMYLEKLAVWSCNQTIFLNYS